MIGMDIDILLVGPARQRGMAALISILFLLIVVAFAVLVALSMSGSDINDTAMQHNSINALFLVESGVERASQRYGSGTACGAGLLDVAAITLGGGSFQVIAPTPFVVTGLCQVRVRGTYGGSTRTLDALISGVTATGGSVNGPIVLEAANAVGSAAGVNTLTVPLTVGGVGRVLVVGITVDTAPGSAVNTVTYASQALTFRGRAGNNPLTEIWTLVNPPAGTANVVVTLSGNDQIVVGALSFTGVNLTTPLDVALVTTTGNSNTASATITPATANAWIVDVVSVNNGVAITMGALTNRQSRWNLRLGGSVTGAGSILGPVSPAAARTLQWTWGGGNRSWAQVALALRPAPQLVIESEVVQ